MRSYNGTKKPKIWDIKSIRPTLSDAQIALELSTYFNCISSEFDPQMPNEVPKTFDRVFPVLRLYQIAGRIRTIKKLKLKIKWDIFSSLMTAFADIIDIPLTEIYNTITETFIWPLYGR